jgi:hypothetical protein
MLFIFNYIKISDSLKLVSVRSQEVIKVQDVTQIKSTCMSGKISGAEIGIARI